MKYRLQLGNTTTTYDTYGDAVLAARLKYDGQIICHIDATPERAPYTTAAWWNMAAIIRAERAYEATEAAAYEMYGEDALASEAALMAAWEDVERANAHAENYEMGVMVDHKMVQDVGGWWTDYTLYTDGGERWYCVFGDTDIYGPDAGADFETDDEREAYEWFDCYIGPSDDDDDGADDDYTLEDYVCDTMSEADKDSVVAVWTRGYEYVTDGRYYTWEDGHGTVWNLDRDYCLIRHRGTGVGCFWTDWEKAC